MFTTVILRLQAIDFTTLPQRTASDTMRVPGTSGRRELSMRTGIFFFIRFVVAININIYVHIIIIFTFITTALSSASFLCVSTFPSFVICLLFCTVVPGYSP